MAYVRTLSHCKTLSVKNVATSLQEMPKKEETCRRFTLSYHLSDDTISIYEQPIANSGFVGGKYLDRCRVARPGSTAQAPTYYGPEDLYIGAVVDIFRRRFVVVDADHYVLKYMEEHPHQFPGLIDRFCYGCMASELLK
jgi:hypothetical protein